jgi:peptidoglycan lytic transglycosylase
MPMAVRRRPSTIHAGALALVLLVWPRGSEMPLAEPAAPDRPSLQDLWLVPASRPAGRAPSLAKAAAELADGKAAQALPAFARAERAPVIGRYARLNAGRAELSLKRPAQAAAAARAILETSPTGYLREAALWLAADAAQAASDWPAAVRALTSLTDGPSLTPEAAWLRLGLASEQTNDHDTALNALTKVYYDYALTPEADQAGAEMGTLVSAWQPTRESFALDFRRAQQLFGAHRYRDARQAFGALRDLAAADNRALIDVRVAECDFFTDRYAAARDALQTYIDTGGPRLAEARYYYFSALRHLGQDARYLDLAKAFIATSADATLVEDALNDLGTYYILQNDDEQAAAVFADQYRRFPTGAHADRAAWQSGWWAYRTGRYAETVRVFDAAVASLPDSDYRPSWLYWAARARLQLGQREAATSGLRTVVAEYRNSYYGREAARLLDRAAAARPSAGGRLAPAVQQRPPAVDGGSPPPNADRIRALLAAGLYDDAIGELKFARLESGSTPVIEATLAYALNRKGDLRPAITTMRRAYPEFVAEGGEALPADILTIIFPIDYWDLVYKYATAHKLDPYLMASLIKQESTFEPTAHSSANAWGLMQVLPSTGRRYARTLGIRGFRTSRLTNPEINIRIGMAYFADLVDQFGDVAAAIAAYNAGESRVSEWVAERPGFDRDEFIDDIPYPETRAYVKRVVGSADDYRALYQRPKN